MTTYNYLELPENISCFFVSFVLAFCESVIDPDDIFQRLILFKIYLKSHFCEEDKHFVFTEFPYISKSQTATSSATRSAKWSKELCIDCSQSLTTDNFKGPGFV